MSILDNEGHDPNGLGNMPTRTEIERLTALVRAQDEYIILLEESEKMLLPLAHAHGFRFKPEMVDLGSALRAEIDSLKIIR